VVTMIFLSPHSKPHMVEMDNVCVSVTAARPTTQSIGSRDIARYAGTTVESADGCHDPMSHDHTTVAQARPENYPHTDRVIMAISALRGHSHTRPRGPAPLYATRTGQPSLCLGSVCLIFSFF
jgi:hypothetical protein